MFGDGGLSNCVTGNRNDLFGRAKQDDPKSRCRVWSRHAVTGMVARSTTAPATGTTVDSLALPRFVAVGQAFIGPRLKFGGPGPREDQPDSEPTRHTKPPGFRRRQHPHRCLEISVRFPYTDYSRKSVSVYVGYGVKYYPLSGFFIQVAYLHWRHVFKFPDLCALTKRPHYLGFYRLNGLGSAIVIYKEISLLRPPHFGDCITRLLGVDATPHGSQELGEVLVVLGHSYRRRPQA